MSAVDSLKQIDLPIDTDNEALIVSNAILSAENRKTFLRKVNYLDFRYKEYQVISWSIRAVEEAQMDLNLDAILLKSKSCPVRYNVEFLFLQTLIDNFGVISGSNYESHITKLQLDKTKSELAALLFNSIYPACQNPQADINYLAERLRSASSIIEKGYTYSQSQFKGMDEVMSDYALYRSTTQGFYSTGFRQLDAVLTEGLKPKGITIYCGLPSMGKCEKKDTPIIMADGSIKMVQNIKVGDLVMGPDSKPRKVLNTTTGVDEMFKVHQKRNEDYTVNSHHLIAVKACRNLGKRYQKNDAAFIKPQDFINESKHYREVMQGYKAPIDFPEKSLKIDPYFLGIWLGDGTSSNTDITTQDVEVRDFLKSYAPTINLVYREKLIENKTYLCSINSGPTCVGKRENILLNELRSYNVLNNKHIPFDFKCNSRENRLKLLAGLIDSDGFKTSTCLEITTKYEALKDDICFLVRSLGFCATWKEHVGGIKSLNFEGQYFTVTISGDNFEEIPLKLKYKYPPKKIGRSIDPLKTPIWIEPLGKDTYYGFEVDQDHLFLLGDFTVTHNSSFVVSSMYNLSNMGVYCPQFALEMDNNALATKLTSFASRLSVVNIAKNFDKLSKEERNLLDYEMTRLSRNKYIYLNDTPSQSLPGIREQIMILQDKLQVEYMNVSIDLFGKIKEFATAENFASEYEKKLNITQQMAKELGVNLGLVAQINRAVMNRRFSRPKMSDLKNAGAWEEVADLIIGIHRPYYDPEVAMKKEIAASTARFAQSHSEEMEDEEEDPNANLAEAIILKQRMGAKDKIINFVFDPDTTRYNPIAEEYQSAINSEKSEPEDEEY